MEGIAPAEVTAKFARAIEDLAQGRAARKAGNIADAYIREIRGEKLLFASLSEVGCTRLGNDILTEWEGSLASHPLELDLIQALIYTPPLPDIGDGRGVDPAYPEIFGDWGECDRDD